MPIAIVSSANEAAWHYERARRVTKSRATRLTNPSIATFKSIHGESSFKGNEATRRGHRLEPVAASWVEAQLGIPESQILYAHAENPLHAATPDCALEDEGEWLVVEIKTTDKDWSAGLPKSVVRDVLWQRYVMSASYSAVAWWRVDEQGQPVTPEPTLVEVEEDPHELQKMIDGADAYLAWVEAGCPDTDDESGLPLEIVEAVAAVNAGKAAEVRIRAWCERGGEEVNKTIPAGSIRFSVSESTSFDKAKYLKANPEAALIVAGAEDLLKTAQKEPEYRKPTVRTSLTIAPPKEEKEAA